MAGSGVLAAEMLSKLELARTLALQDPQVYTQVIPGVVSIIQPGALLEVRRWGADFLAECFASPLLNTAQKEQLTSDVLPVLKGMLDNSSEDLTVIKSAIQACASIYPVIFRRMISHPDQALIWQDMTAVKVNILRRMDSAPPPVRVACIKFVQKVVQVQTPGVIADPRRPDSNETSIALVPRNHPLLPLPNIEAETSGLLDRLLSVLQEQSSNALMVDGTMNCLAVLIKTRPAIANKILSAIVNYNPFKDATNAMTPKQIVIFKSLERTTRALLRYVLKIFQNHPMEPKIHAYLMRLQQTRTALFSDSQAMKRPAETTNGPENSRRPRLALEPRRFPPMPPPPNSYAQLFTLTEDRMLQQFDTKLLGVDMVSNIVGLLLQHIDSKTLDESIEAVRLRWEHVKKTSRPTPVPVVPLAGPIGIDDEDDYDPELIGAADQVVSPATEKALEELAQPIIDLGPFELPKPPPLSTTEVALLSDQSVSRVFDIANAFDRIPASARQKSGLNRLAASGHDRDAWITVLTRLATRASAGLDVVVAAESKDNSSNSPTLKQESVADLSSSAEPANIANRIRQTLFHYVLEDWKARLNIAISWLTEEWYADTIGWKTKLLASNHEAVPDRPVDDSEKLPNYTRILTRILAHLLPRFDSADSKLLIRFVSELPHLSPFILGQVRSLARDPGTVKICLLALQYLILFRPPTREMVLDTLQDIWLEGDAGVKSDVGKVLNKWRPGFEERVPTGAPPASIDSNGLDESTAAVKQDTSVDADTDLKSEASRSPLSTDFRGDETLQDLGRVHTPAQIQSLEAGAGQ